MTLEFYLNPLSPIFLQRKYRVPPVFYCNAFRMIYRLAIGAYNIFIFAVLLCILFSKEWSLYKKKRRAVDSSNTLNNRTLVCLIRCFIY